MLFAYSKRIPPKELYHKAELRDVDGNTVAMILARKGIIPPSEWEHDKYLRNFNGMTVNKLL